MIVSAISGHDLDSAKRAFTTRRVPRSEMQTILTGDIRPAVGDLALAVVEKVDSHRKIELTSGRRAHLAVGDRIIVAYGNRYAPDQFEAIVGKSIGQCHLIAAGGIAATKVAKHETMKNPTRIDTIGLLGNGVGQRLNLAQFALPMDRRSRPIATIFVAGTAMNAGKTMTSASLIHAFVRAGYRVAGIKSTGTGAGGDLWFMSDMGAHVVLDFTDAGMPSTYLAAPEQIETNVLGLIGHAADLGCEVAVVEIADGLQHEETATLLASPAIRNAGRGIVFAANDALGAQAGVTALRHWGYRVFALSGQLTRSPLALREAARSTGIPVLTATELQAGGLTDIIMNAPWTAPAPANVVSITALADRAASIGELSARPVEPANDLAPVQMTAGE